MKIVEVYNNRTDDALPENLGDLVEDLTSKLMDIPDEYRKSAAMEVESEDDGYGCHYNVISISYRRPWTGAEIAARDQAEKQRESYQENREKAELKRLQAKYK